MDIRNIYEQDLPACAELFAQVFSQEPWNEPWSQEAAFKRLSHFYQSRGFAGVLLQDQNLIGFAFGNVEPFYFGDLFYLREMCVDPAMQNSGNGQLLMSSLQEMLQQQGVKGIYLTTEQQITAAQFYQKQGFQPSESMRFYSKRIGQKP